MMAGKLVCFGCAHSAATVPYPSRPSGELPCCFCIRNPDREAWQARHVQDTGQRLETWYDGSKPVKVPMDCYHSLDMATQIHAWLKVIPEMASKLLT